MSYERNGGCLGALASLNEIPLLTVVMGAAVVGVLYAGAITSEATNIPEAKPIDQKDPYGPGRLDTPTIEQPSAVAPVPQSSEPGAYKEPETYNAGAAIIEALPFGKRGNSRSENSEQQPSAAPVVSQENPGGDLCDQGAFYKRKIVTGISKDGKEFNGKAAGADNYWGVNGIQCDEIGQVYSAE